MLSPLRPTRWRYVWQFLFDFWWTALIQLWGEVKLVAVHKTDRARSLLSKMAVRPDENAYLYYFSWALVTSQLSYLWRRINGFYDVFQYNSQLCFHYKQKYFSPLTGSLGISSDVCMLSWFACLCCRFACLLNTYFVNTLACVCTFLNSQI